MEYRQLGSSPVKASVITFGAWAIGGWMWGGSDRKEAVDAIKASYDAGVTSIDTAPAYGQGLSEEIVAEAIQYIPRDKVQILTKFGLRWDVQQGEFFFKSKDNDGRDIDMHKYASRESVIKECEDCLRRLQTDYIDLFQIHWPDSTTPVAETMEALLRLQEQGKILAAGVCNYSATLMKEAERTISLASNQVPYSMVLRDIEKELVPYCIDNNKSIIAYSPLQRGLLTGKIKPGHTFGEGDTREGNRFYTTENITSINSMLDSLRTLAAEKNATLAQLVLRWTVDQPGITIALAGARNAQQAVQNAKAADVKLTKEDVDFINDKLGKLELVMP
ncbi:aldo/keto reductase [Niastella sp. OAS944]|uniref:aldo/keto reductase n=1 Tax=Niastella sp. OAS944 TaxID=2664089 RepID=UPI00347D3ABB|nr:aryl-alcohol dehydrogenase-like predicted oxidoreductase [Chitinophagaceae bacterium OAS944]